MFVFEKRPAAANSAALSSTLYGKRRDLVTALCKFPCKALEINPKIVYNETQ